jgi:hypothetical protein
MPMIDTDACYDQDEPVTVIIRGRAHSEYESCTPHGVTTMGKNRSPLSESRTVLSSVQPLAHSSC